MEVVLEGGEGGVGPAVGGVAGEPAVGEAGGEVGAETIGGGGGGSWGEVGEGRLVRGEVEGEGGVAVGEVRGDLEDGGTAEAAMGEEELVTEGWRRGAGAVWGGSCGGDDFGGDAGDLAPEGEVGWGEGEGDERGAGWDEGDAEVLRDLVADAGGADLGDGEATGGDDEG